MLLLLPKNPSLQPKVKFLSLPGHFKPIILTGIVFLALEEDPGLKQVKDWRHKLQRAFLGKDGPLISVSFPRP